MRVRPSLGIGTESPPRRTVLPKVSDACEDLGHSGGDRGQARGFHQTVAQTSQPAVVAKRGSPWLGSRPHLAPLPCGAFFLGLPLARRTRKYFRTNSPSIAVRGCLQT